MTSDLPRHVAIIMDGNGRWASKRSLPRIAGHRAGVENVRAIVKHSAELGIEVLTLFAFSSENWRRPPVEVRLLMDLFVMALEQEAERLHENGVCLRVVGDRVGFPAKLRRSIAAAEALTAGNQALTLIIAANYGGRWDVTEATRRLAEEVAAGRLQPADITVEMLGNQLMLRDVPEPDLFIRSGGEQRISNFLLWQLAYTELYFTNCLWPDFDRAQYEEALASYTRRQRRFGMTGEQIEAASEAATGVG
ncbi:MAG: isoprenyl transferase [Gammaproteobacteria bacterium]|nr:isoprenyl transferase [Gammaproteobacteria bacterium]